MSTTRLCNATVWGFADDIAVPAYDRSGMTVGIVHIGVGAFHRSHQAAYLDQLMSTSQALDWAVCGIDLLPADRQKAEIFARQDGLYTLMLKHADGSIEPRVIGSLAEYIFAPGAPERAINRLTDPRTRIVTLTVTEGGYNVHPVTGEFDADNPDIPADLDSFLLHGHAPPPGMATAEVQSAPSHRPRTSYLRRSLDLAQRILMDVFDNLPPDPPPIGLNVEHINQRNFAPALEMLELLGGLYTGLVASRALRTSAAPLP